MCFLSWYHVYIEYEVVEMFQCDIPLTIKKHPKIAGLVGRCLTPLALSGLLYRKNYHPLNRLVRPVVGAMNTWLTKVQGQTERII